MIFSCSRESCISAEGTARLFVTFRPEYVVEWLSTFFFSSVYLQYERNQSCLQIFLKTVYIGF